MQLELMWSMEKGILDLEHNSHLTFVALFKKKDAKN